MPGDPFYATAEWRKFRAGILAERPRCEVVGCLKMSIHVDHRVTRASGGAPFDPANVQALCHSHHSQKTARTDRPSYRATDKPLRPKGCGADGMPIDPQHPWRTGRG